MNKIISYIFLAFVILSCGKQNPKDQKKFLEGYWEIDKVEMPGDSIVEYKASTTIDYLEIDGDSGFRKKMKPQISGNFKTTDDAEQVTLKIEDDSLRMYYKTPFDEWKETVLEIGEESLKILNRDGIIYHYKKYKPLFEDDEEER